MGGEGRGAEQRVAWYRPILRLVFDILYELKVQGEPHLSQALHWRAGDMLAAPLRERQRDLHFLLEKAW